MWKIKIIISSVSSKFRQSVIGNSEKKLSFSKICPWNNCRCAKSFFNLIFHLIQSNVKRKKIITNPNDHKCWNIKHMVKLDTWKIFSHTFLYIWETYFIYNSWDFFYVHGKVSLGHFTQLLLIEIGSDMFRNKKNREIHEVVNICSFIYIWKIFCRL